MTITSLLPDGKYSVTFNGSAIFCNTSMDCPGDAECFLNASWAEYPNECACSIFYVQTGPQCNTFNWSVGWYIFILETMLIIAYALQFLLCTYILLQGFRFRIKFSFGTKFSLLTSLLCCAVWGFFYGPSALLMLLSVSYVDQKLLDAPYYTAAQYLGISLSVFSYLQVSLNWLATVELSKRFEKRHAYAYRIMIYMLNLIVLVLLVLEFANLIPFNLFLISLSVIIFFISMVL